MKTIFLFLTIFMTNAFAETYVTAYERALIRKAADSVMLRDFGMEEYSPTLKNVDLKERTENLVKVVFTYFDPAGSPYGTVFCAFTFDLTSKNVVKGTESCKH